MTVRELIEHLQTLDQDKGIWICYDSYVWFPPTPDETAAEDYRDGMVKKGDYVIIAG